MTMQRGILGLILLALAGCNTNYSCGQFPQTGCQPISAVNEAVSGEVYDYRKDFYKKKERENGDGQRNVAVNISAVPNALNYASPGDVILTKPLVLRVLIDSWEDENKNLHAGGYVFVRVKESEWIISK